MLLTETSPRVASTQTTSGRLFSLDAFRGLAVAFMILVSNPGSGAIYTQLNHAPWNGWTATDVVFPSFLWIVGVAITLALGKRLEHGVPKQAIFLQACRRAVILYLLGVLIYAIPEFNPHTFRILGVLQRIAICYLVATALYLWARLRTQIIWIAGLMAVYWIAMKCIPVPGYGAGNLSIEGNFAHYVDWIVLGHHNYAATRTWDPEGIVSTLPAICTTLFGMMAGYMLRLKKTVGGRAVRLFVSGFLLLIAGLICNVWLPINKHLWTDSFALFMAGLDFMLFAVFLWCLDGLKFRRGIQPLLIFGKNALAVYMVSELLSAILRGVTVGGVSIHDRIFQATFSGLASAPMASLFHAITWLLCMYAFAWFLYWKQWFLKV